MAESKVPKIIKSDSLQVPHPIDLPSESEDDRPLNSLEQKKQKGKKTPSIPEMDLNILLKFIKSYDGCRETLNSFIINCNNAFDLASDWQKPILFKFILSQLSGKAEAICSIKDFLSWEQLKEFLKTQFSQRKHYTHLLTELQECKQEPNENVSQFSLRIETCLSQLLTEISLNSTKVKEIPGRVAAMEDLALHHFTMGLHPRISNFVRCRTPKNLNEAINIAISEERVHQNLFKRNDMVTTFSKPLQPRRQVVNLNNSMQKSFEPSRPTSRIPYQSTSKVCNYCKNIGHTIENCRKREYNNRRYGKSSFSRPQQSVNYSQAMSDNGRDEVDDVKN